MKRTLVDELEAPRQTTEREVVLRRFLDLATVDQIWVFERTVEAMTLTSAVPPELDRQLTMRAETLEALRLVQEHLGLDRPPTVGEYNDTRAQLGISWSSAKIIRVWGRWRDAVAALAGERDRSTVAERAYRRTYLGSRRTREEPLAAVRLWLKSVAGSGFASDYDAWAREYNLTLAGDALPMPRLSTIKHSLALGWSEIVAIARGERPHPDVAAVRRDHGDWSRGPHDLIAIRTIAHLIGVSDTVAKKRTYRPGFPAHVLTLPGNRRAWLRGDVAAYLRGEQVERRANELADLYFDAMEVADLLGISYPQEVKRYEIQPAGRAGGRHYWLRGEVEAWLAANAARVAARKAKARRPGTQPAHPSRDFVNAKDVRAMLGTTKAVVTDLARDPRFPKPVATLGHGRVWLRKDIEAFMTDESFPARPENALQEKLIEAGELSDLLGVGKGFTDRRRDLAPPPAGRAGSRNFWVRAEVEEWLDEDPSRRDKVALRKRR